MRESSSLTRELLKAAFASLLIIAYLIGCASEPKRVAIPATANPNQEIESFNADLTELKLRQADVLSPHNFEKAQKQLERAQQRRQDRASSEKILEAVGLGRAYLNLARQTVVQMEEEMPELIAARHEALRNSANVSHKRELTSLDNELRSHTRTAESGAFKMTTGKKFELHKKYLDVELAAIKHEQLSPVRAMIESARKQQAPRWSPETFDSAVSKLNAAEAVIETDRHNRLAIQEAVFAARDEARKLVTVTEYARQARTQPPEALALEKEATVETMQEMRRQLEAKETALQERERALAAREREISTLSQERAALQEERNFEESLARVREEFHPGEADVYRDGNNLLIRLKSMHFEPGRSALSSDAMEILNRVRDTIREVGADRVRIEGHTDTTGSPTTNKILAEERAKSVADYLIQQEAVGEEQVEARGIGDAKPIANNKTPEGRAQNRRVDIVITPSKAE